MVFPAREESTAAESPLRSQRRLFFNLDSRNKSRADFSIWAEYQRLTVCQAGRELWKGTHDIWKVGHDKSWYRCLVAVSGGELACRITMT